VELPQTHLAPYYNNPSTNLQPSILCLDLEGSEKLIVAALLSKP
jgi:hypothetical protein